MDKLIKISSITKKIVVALLGAFLLLFLLFHATANLLVLKDDGGSAYSAFCHFMGSNIIVKIFEILLLASILLHIILTIILWFQNKKARPIPYHIPTKSKTAPSSKLMILTGTLLLICIGLHFYDFYLVKIGVVKRIYMAKIEDIQSDEVITLQHYCDQMETTPQDFIGQYEQNLEVYKSMLPEDDFSKLANETEAMKRAIPVIDFLQRIDNSMVSSDHKWITQINYDDKVLLEKAIPTIDVEPDFYNMVHQLFKRPLMVVMYLLFFAILWFHMRHAFEAAFQTLGLSNYKYYRAIEIIGIIYAWCICLMFASIPIGILLLF
ncbi:MAG: hypothetical protein K6E93_09660 [Bacteroidales bacterium]|nr:hypothetical protein [Bacteroidales bacterium]